MRECDVCGAGFSYVTSLCGDMVKVILIKSGSRQEHEFSSSASRENLELELRGWLRDTNILPECLNGLTLIIVDDIKSLTYSK